MTNDTNLDIRRDHSGGRGMSHITERPQVNGTTEYDVFWRDSNAGTKKKYEADSKDDALRFKRAVDAQGTSPTDSRRS